MKNYLRELLQRSVSNNFTASFSRVNQYLMIIFPFLSRITKWGNLEDLDLFRSYTCHKSIDNFY